MRPATFRVKRKETYSWINFSRLYKHDAGSLIVASHTIPVTVGPDQGDVLRLLAGASLRSGLDAQRLQRLDEAIEILGVEEAGAAQHVLNRRIANQQFPAVVAIQLID